MLSSNDGRRNDHDEPSCRRPRPLLASNGHGAGVTKIRRPSILPMGRLGLRHLHRRRVRVQCVHFRILHVCSVREGSRIARPGVDNRRVRGYVRLWWAEGVYWPWEFKRRRLFERSLGETRHLRPSVARKVLSGRRAELEDRK